MASHIDLPALGTDCTFPMFVVEGAHDLLALLGIAQRYYTRLKAPQQYLVILEHAGDDPNHDVVDAG